MHGTLWKLFIKQQLKNKLQTRFEVATLNTSQNYLLSLCKVLEECFDNWIISENWEENWKDRFSPSWGKRRKTAMTSKNLNNRLVETQLMYSTSPSSKVGDPTPFSGNVSDSIHGNSDGTNNSNDHPKVTSPMTNIQNAISEMLKTIRNSTACTSETINCQEGLASVNSESGARKSRPTTDGQNCENNGNVLGKG